VFAMTPISRVAGHSGLLVRGLFAGDGERLGVLCGDVIGVDNCCGGFARASGAVDGEMVPSLMKIFYVARRWGGELIRSDRDPAWDMGEACEGNGGEENVSDVVGGPVAIVVRGVDWELEGK